MNLKVAEDAPLPVIRNAWRALIQHWHPDRFGSEAEKARAESISRIINAAYEVLSDPVKRKEHDEWIAEQQATYDRLSPSQRRDRATQDEANDSSTPPQPVDAGTKLGPTVVKPAARSRVPVVVAAALVLVAIVGVASKDKLFNYFGPSSPEDRERRYAEDIAKVVKSATYLALSSDRFDKEYQFNAIDCLNSSLREEVREVVRKVRRGELDPDSPLDEQAIKKSLARSVDRVIGEGERGLVSIDGIDHRAICYSHMSVYGVDVHDRYERNAHSKLKQFLNSYLWTFVK